MNALRIPFPLLLAAGLLLSGCNIGAPMGPTATPTLSSEDVLRTAEAIAEATRQAATATPTVEPVTPTATAVPETLTPTMTATPANPLVVADYNANVRSGPGEVFEVIDFLLQGDQANAEGRFLHEETGVWYFISREQGLPGWVWGGAVTVAGNADAVPFIDSPPTPTPGPSPTASPTP